MNIREVINLVQKGWVGGYRHERKDADETEVTDVY